MLTNFDSRYVFFSNQIKNFMSKRNESFATYYLIKFINFLMILKSNNDVLPTFS